MISEGTALRNYTKVCFNGSGQDLSLTSSDLSSYVDNMENTANGDYE